MTTRTAYRRLGLTPKQLPRETVLYCVACEPNIKRWLAEIGPRSLDDPIFNPLRVAAAAWAQKQS